MATVNLNTDYRQPLAEAFEYAPVFAGKTTDAYAWRGANAVVLTEIVTEPLNDYDRTASGNRYGTPSEVGDARQILTLQRDRSFSKAVDRGNYQEQNYLKTGAAVVKAYLNEQAAPEMERFMLAELAANAGQVLTADAAPAKDTILEAVLAVETAMDDARVPKKDRFLLLPNAYVAYLRESLTACNDITDRMLLKGIVGNVGSLHILGTSASDFPAGLYMLAWQKQSAALPKTIEDAKVSNDVPGISGILVEGRFRYGAFVVSKRANGVVAMVASGTRCEAPTVTAGGTGLSLSSATSGATMFYTLDGTDPRYSASALPYTAQIPTPASGTVLRAVAKKAGMFASPVTEYLCV
ncbi:MAG: chitobiase/beta-hexosaminidase C-terminal domain-containing protein [Clostridia bacterium]|nr:chitobiase/beta-hexosaminidase C-terminal domain-containing protein [Clostridia bacterium]